MRFFFFQAEDGIRDLTVTGVQTCALPIFVFVGDSQVRQLDENIESLQNLQSNLLEHGVDVRTMPFVMQYNKQDLPAELILTPADLDDALNFRGVPSFAADALHGRGVFETLKGISELVLKKLAAGAPTV